MTMRNLLRRWRHDSSGVMAIETALVAPILVVLSLGAFQISGIVARQVELQGAAQEAQAIALATTPDTPEKQATLKSVIVASTELAAEKVTVEPRYRCSNSANYVTTKASCVSGTTVSTYVRINLADTYTPVWTRFGVGSPYNMSVERYLIVAQATQP